MKRRKSSFSSAQSLALLKAHKGQPVKPGRTFEVLLRYRVIDSNGVITDMGRYAIAKGVAKSRGVTVKELIDAQGGM